MQHTRILPFAEEDPVALQACENNLCQDSLRGVFLQPFGAKALAQPPMPGIQSTVQSDYPMCAESIAGHTQSKHSGTKRSTSWPVQSNLSGQTVEDEATMQDTRAPQGWTANMPAVGQIYFSGSPYERSVVHDPVATAAF